MVSLTDATGGELNVSFASRVLPASNGVRIVENIPA